MAFLSYAQNFEDVMLWRALGHIPNGLYVDVGAQHPRIDSVSRAFYEHGWRGVHVEPVPAFAQMLREDRPDETVLQVALGETEGTLALNVFADTGLSTAVTAYADRHIAERNYSVERIEVPVLTLNAALVALQGREVHWLKVDVEGFEEQVLRGWDSKMLRPWVIVVEATVPNLPDTDYAGWDPILTAANYTFVYFDGLNRFYVAAEHAELAAAFAVPPNVFDATELSGLASWGLARPIIEQRDALAARVDAAEANREQSATALALVEELLRQSKSHTADLTAELEESVVTLAYRETALATAKRDVLHERWLAVDAQRERESMARLLSESQQLQVLVNHRLTAVIAERNEARAKVAELNQQVGYWWQCADGLNQQLAMFYQSRSWRLTAPVRVGARVVRKLRRLAAGVKRRLMRHAVPAQVAAWIAPAPAEGSTSVAPRKLSVHAEGVYSDLKQAVNELS